LLDGAKHYVALRHRVIEAAMVSRCLVFFRVFLGFLPDDVCLFRRRQNRCAARGPLVSAMASIAIPALPNPVNDANDIAAALEQLDFTVIRVSTAILKKCARGIRAFNAEVEHADIGLIYYAGHGMESAARIHHPVDASSRRIAT